MKNKINITYITLLIFISCQICNAATVAYWKFDEGTGQVVANSEGSSTAQLTRGNSAGVDTWDNDWADGLYGGAVHGDTFTENGGKAKYCKNIYSWTADDARALAPSASYSVEVIFNVDEYPDYASWDVDNPLGIIAYRDTANTKYQYLLRTNKRDIGGELHKCVHFYSQHSDGTASQIILDVEAAGLDIVPGQWYYVGAIYDDINWSMDLVVRDLQTGITVSKTSWMLPCAGMSATPAPFMLIGTEGGSGRCFNGYIDEVRISNTALAEEERLYNRQVGEWGILEGDLDGNGYVDSNDLAQLAAEWMRCTNPNMPECEITSE